MSKTYRKVHDEVAFCGKCNKPVYYHTVEKYELCNCEPETVEVEGIRHLSNGKPIYETTRDVAGNFIGIVLKGYTEPAKEEYTYKKRLPQSRYYRHNIKVPDGVEGWLFQNEGRKRYQEARNRQHRAKVKQILRNRNLRWEEMVFPANKNQVNWDMY